MPRVTKPHVWRDGQPVDGVDSMICINEGCDVVWIKYPGVDEIDVKPCKSRRNRSTMPSDEERERIVESHRGRRMVEGGGPKRVDKWERKYD